MKVVHFIYFIFFYLGRLISANLRLAREVLTPGFASEPAIIAIELLVRSDHEILAVANLITMTPGTLTLDISADRRTIYVHAMYVNDVEAFKDHIRSLERRVHRLLG